MLYTSSPKSDRCSLLRGLRVAIAAAFTCAMPFASAADQTWNGASNGSWTNSLNWVGLGAPGAPGAITGDSSPDTATFNNAGNTAITVDANRNIKNIVFNTASAGPFTFGGGPFVLTSGGAITVNSSVTTTQTFNTNLLLSTVIGSTYSFINNAIANSAKLNINGDVTGQAASGTQTITLGGSKGGTIAGTIENGSAGGSVGLTKSGVGTWTLKGTDTYGGPTLISAGTLEIGGSGSLTGTSSVTVNSASTLLLSTTASTAINGPIALEGGTLKLGIDTANLPATTLKAGAFSFIDTNGVNATFTGAVTGATGGLVKKGDGDLAMNNASNTVGSLQVTGGNVAHSTGTLNTSELVVGTGLGNAASYTLSGGSLNLPTAPSSMVVGDAGGDGTFTQSSGALTSDGTVVVGNRKGTGAFYLSGGTVNIGQSAAPGASSLTLGLSRAADGGFLSMGVFEATGGHLHLFANAPLQIGGDTAPISDTANSVGTFTQSGSAVVTIDSYIALASNGTGTYNLSGGTLEVGGADGIRQGSGTASFNLGGGTLKVIGSNLTTAVNASLVGGTYSVINTNGFNSTLSGSVTGATGGLAKIGTGSLALTNVSNTIGSVLVAGGNVTQSTGTTLTTSELAVGTGAGNTGSYTMTGGSLILPAGTPPPLVGGSASSLRVGDFGGTGTFTQTGGSVSVDGSLNVGNQGGNGTYAISGGSLSLNNGLFSLGRTTGSSATAGTGLMQISGTAAVSVSGPSSFIIGDRDAPGPQGVGTLTQTGGTLSIGASAGLYLAGYGTGNTYNLNGGTLEIGGSSLHENYGAGGTYAFNLGGGTIKVVGSDLTTSVNASLVPATYSVINTNGFNATLSGSVTGAAGGLAKLGAGSLALTNASNTLGSLLVAGGNVTQSTGTTLTTSELAVGTGAGNTGSYTMTGGSLILPAGTPPPLVGGSASSLRVGDFGGTGTFTQSGGSVSVDGSFNIGNQGGNGTYAISGGSLTLNNGLSSIGRTTSSVAGASTGLLQISAAATVNISGTSTLIIGDRDASGPQGVGTITQTGGTLAVGPSAGLYLAGYGTGNTYNLNGGTLEIGGNSLQGNYGAGGTYAFNLGGGTIKVVGSDLITAVSANLMASTTSTINTNGLNASLSGSLSGSGSLVKTGTGTLVFTAASTNSGGTSVSEGTVLANNSSGSALGTGPVTVDTGATLGGNGKVDLSGSNSIFINGALVVGKSGDTAAAQLTLSTVTGSGSTVLGNTSMVFMDIMGGAGHGSSIDPSHADQLRLFGDLTINPGATLVLGNPNGISSSSWAYGDTFQVFSWSGGGTVSGTFTSLDFSALNIPTSLRLDYSELNTTGYISLVPEPSRALLLMFGGIGLMARRRRTLEA